MSRWSRRHAARARSRAPSDPHRSGPRRRATRSAHLVGALLALGTVLTWCAAPGDAAAQALPPFVLHVDAQQQLFIIIDGQPVAVTAPRPEAERDVEERVLAAFCRFNDCSVVNDQGTSRSPDKRDLVGAWLLSQQAPPTFEVDDVLRCEFTDLMRREDKAAACRETAGELVELDQAIRTAADRGYRIDWEILAAHPPSSGGGGQVVVNAAGAFLEARTSMLARLPETDWRNLVEWLRRAPLDKQAPVTLHRAEHMIADR